MKILWSIILLVRHTNLARWKGVDGTEMLGRYSALDGGCAIP